jgi:hypothetical protein
MNGKDTEVRPLCSEVSGRLIARSIQSHRHPGTQPV